MFKLTIIANFDAAHCLPGYPGKCQRLHGHNWKVEVTVTGNKLNSLGMLVDFKELKEALGETIINLDHYYLNDIPAFQGINPTAEHIAEYVYNNLAEHRLFANNNIKISSVKIWESVHSAVEYTEEI